jgi:uncharacterized protein (DUF2062 family)
MRIWAVLALVFSLMPLIIWRVQVSRSRRKRRAAAREAAREAIA